MENLTLEQAVYSEAAIMELLGVNRKQLDTLRLEKGFPCIYLSRRVRVYLAKEVLAFLESIAERR